MKQERDYLKIIPWTRNWGDAISVFVYQKLSGKTPQTIPVYEDSSKLNYLTVGSILRMCDSNSVVWGSGFLSENDSLGVLHWRKTDGRCVRKPRSVLAVRGPMTRKKLLDLDVPCPEIYGDPALLFPNIYQPKIKKQFRLGVITHHADRSLPYVNEFCKRPDVLLIDTVFPRSYWLLGDKRIYKFVDEVLACDQIISSSLHGMVVADAYGIPGTWVRFPPNIRKDNFKFQDYFQSVGHRSPIDVCLADSIKTLAQLARANMSARAEFDPAPLIDNCPFYDSRFSENSGPVLFRDNS